MSSGILAFYGLPRRATRIPARALYGIAGESHFLLANTRRISYTEVDRYFPRRWPSTYSVPGE